MTKTALSFCACAFLLLCALPAHAERTAHPLRDALAHKLAAKRTTADTPTPAPQYRDVAYGTDAAQKFDIYLPEQPVSGAPVIFMVHGGGWRNGDKTNSNAVANKAAYFTARGWIFISTNYRLLPAANPLEQAQDVGRAVAYAQQHAAQWGGDQNRFVLMGHSAGAHLVALVSARPDLLTTQGGTAWLATVALDSAGYDIEKVMQARHFKLYDEAFGTDTALWHAASPAAQLAAKMPPFLAVCSTQRTSACEQARILRDRAQAFGGAFDILPVDMKHGEINAQLGVDNDYTASVLDFLKRNAGL